MNFSTSAALIAQIDSLTVPHGQLALWSLGQAGFVIKGGATIAYIDPYLSDRITASGASARRFPVPLDPRAVGHAGRSQPGAGQGSQRSGRSSR